jgi:hypothetical protein
LVARSSFFNPARRGIDAWSSFGGRKADVSFNIDTKFLLMHSYAQVSWAVNIADGKTFLERETCLPAQDCEVEITPDEV